jgi:DNA-binding response OmpR family regulator
MEVMATTEPPPSAPSRILVVEDDTAVRDFCVRLLRMNGYQVLSATNGIEALERLKEYRYDLVMTDLQMPQMGGIPLLREMRQHYPDTDTIVFTAHATVETAREALKLGAFDYLVKPVSVHDLEGTIRSALEERRARLEKEHISRLMPSQEEIQDQQELLSLYRRRLAYHLTQQATLGTSAPFSLIEEIRAVRQEVARIKAILRSWKVEVSDHPNDTVTPTETDNVATSTLQGQTSSSSTHPHMLRIFLCHSSDDKPQVRELYQKLCTDGFEPWLDEEDLLPGQDWQREMPKAIRAADIVPVCLSKPSITKAGYVQKEIKYALDVADMQPEGTIFLIPVKLEPCDVPERLSMRHWVNLYEPSGYGRLLRALLFRSHKTLSGSYLSKQP